MNKKQLLVPVAATLLVLSAPGFAEEGDWYIKPGLQYIDYDSKRGFDDEELGGSLGFEYDRGEWGTELQLFGNDADPKGGGSDIDVKGASLNLYRYFNHEESFNPYIVVGLGRAEFGDDSGDEHETQGNLGLGLRSQLKDNLSWWADVRGVHGLDDSTTDTVFGLGLALNIGGSDSSPTPSDSDGDGVTDANDNCPDTPRGAAVDSNGCALDSDGDGVPDYKDECPNTAAGVVVASNGCKVKHTRVEEVTLAVQFETNSDKLRDSSQQEIADLADFMKRHADLHVVLEGHTDSTGKAEYNLDLSNRRAQSVANELSSRYSIDASRITAKGFGETQPIASNETSEGRAQNRRVIAALTKQITE